MAPRSLSGFGQPGCKSVCAVHISAASWPIEPLWAGEPSKICSSHSRIFASTTKARQAPSQGAACYGGNCCTAMPETCVMPASARGACTEKAIRGHRRQLLLQCRHTDHPWPSPEIAPAFPAYRPSMAIKQRPQKRASSGLRGRVIQRQRRSTRNTASQPPSTQMPARLKPHVRPCSQRVLEIWRSTLTELPRPVSTWHML